jgi:hypothetical protein
MFSGCQYLGGYIILTATFSQLRGMIQMFLNCNNIVKIEFLNATFENLTTMTAAFMGCETMTECHFSSPNNRIFAPVGSEGSDVITMDHAWARCFALQSLTIANKEAIASWRSGLSPDANQLPTWNPYLNFAFSYDRGLASAHSSPLTVVPPQPLTITDASIVLQRFRHTSALDSNQIVDLIDANDSGLNPPVDSSPLLTINVGNRFDPASLYALFEFIGPSTNSSLTVGGTTTLDVANHKVIVSSLTIALNSDTDLITAVNTRQTLIRARIGRITGVNPDTGNAIVEYSDFYTFVTTNWDDLSLDNNAGLLQIPPTDINIDIPADSACWNYVINSISITAANETGVTAPLTTVQTWYVPPPVLSGFIIDSAVSASINGTVATGVSGIWVGEGGVMDDTDTVNTNTNITWSFSRDTSSFFSGLFPPPSDISLRHIKIWAYVDDVTYSVPLILNCVQPPTLTLSIDNDTNILAIHGEIPSTGDEVLNGGTQFHSS